MCVKKGKHVIRHILKNVNATSKKRMQESANGKEKKRTPDANCRRLNGKESKRKGIENLAERNKQGQSQKVWIERGGMQLAKLKPDDKTT